MYGGHSPATSRHVESSATGENSSFPEAKVFVFVSLVCKIRSKNQLVTLITKHHAGYLRGIFLPRHVSGLPGISRNSSSERRRAVCVTANYYSPQHTTLHWAAGVGSSREKNENINYLLKAPRGRSGTRDSLVGKVFSQGSKCC